MPSQTADTFNNTESLHVIQIMKDLQAKDNLYLDEEFTNLDIVDDLSNQGSIDPDDLYKQQLDGIDLPSNEWHFTSNDNNMVYHKMSPISPPNRSLTADNFIPHSNNNKFKFPAFSNEDSTMQLSAEKIPSILSKAKIKSKETRQVTFDEEVVVHIIPNYYHNSETNSEQKQCTFTKKLSTAPIGISYASKKINDKRRYPIHSKNRFSCSIKKKDKNKWIGPLLIPTICVVALL